MRSPAGSGVTVSLWSPELQLRWPCEPTCMIQMHMDPEGPESWGVIWTSSWISVRNDVLKSWQWNLVRPVCLQVIYRRFLSSSARGPQPGTNGAAGSINHISWARAHILWWTHSRLTRVSSWRTCEKVSWCSLNFTLNQRHPVRFNNHTANKQTHQRAACTRSGPLSSILILSATVM